MIFFFYYKLIFEKEVGADASGSTKFDLSNQIMFKNFPLDNYNMGFLGFSEFGEVSELTPLIIRSIYTVCK